MRFRTVFDYDDIASQCPDGFIGNHPSGTRFTYAQEVVSKLAESGHEAAAAALVGTKPDEYDLFAFEPGTFKVIGQKQLADSIA